MDRYSDRSPAAPSSECSIEARLAGVAKMKKGHEDLGDTIWILIRHQTLGCLSAFAHGVRIERRGMGGPLCTSFVDFEEPAAKTAMFPCKSRMPTAQSNYSYGCVKLALSHSALREITFKFSSYLGMVLKQVQTITLWHKTSKNFISMRTLSGDFMWMCTI